MQNNNFTTYKAGLDWITWYSEVWEDISYMREIYLNWVCLNGGKDSRTKLLRRFTGAMCGGVGFGENRMGGVLVGEGENSSKVAESCMLGKWSSGAHVTRLDLQVTVRQPGRYSGLAMLRSITNGYGSTPTIITDKLGLSTVYLGSRESEKMLRIYQKPDSQGQLFLRFEIELKGSLARELWKKGVSENVIRGFLSAEFSKLRMKKYAMNALEEVGDYLSGVEGVKVTVGKPIPNTMYWLEESVTPAIIRLLNFPESRDYMANMIESWAEIARDKRGFNDEKHI